MTVTNNIIANNVATHEGGGVAIDDTPNVDFMDNTVVRNITTATAVTSDGRPAPAGLSTGANSALLQSKLPSGSLAWSKPNLVNNIFADNRAGSWTPTGITGIGKAGDPTPIVTWDMGTVDGAGVLTPDLLDHAVDARRASGPGRRERLRTGGDKPTRRQHQRRRLQPALRDQRQRPRDAHQPELPVGHVGGRRHARHPDGRLPPRDRCDADQRRRSSRGLAEPGDAGPRHRPRVPSQPCRHRRRRVPSARRQSWGHQDRRPHDRELAVRPSSTRSSPTTAARRR